MSWIRIASINLLIFVALWTVAEIIFYFSIGQKQVCYHDWVEYGYCSNFSGTRINSEDDGGEEIKIFTDKLGARTNGRNVKKN